MSFHSRFCLLVAALVVMAGIAAPSSAAAQEAAPQEPAADSAPSPSSVFVDTLNVSIVDLDVYVTDKSGAPVLGLTEDDFEVFENGSPVKVTNFYPVADGQLVGGTPRRQPAPAADVPQPPRLPGDEEVDNLPDNQRLYLVIYIDNYNLQPFQRNRVMREVRAFLRTNVRRGDQVMLATYDRELHLRQPFTSNPNTISRALQDLETVSGQAVHRVSDRRDALDQIENSTTVSEALSFARIYAGSMFNDVSFTISALREFVDGLAGVPGRKAVLYVSEGLPMRAGEDLFYAVQDKFGSTTGLTEIFDYDASRRFEALTAAANANRVSFYTVDAGGLRVHGVDVSETTPGRGIRIDQINTSNLQSPLQMMAETTGGKAIINTNRIEDDLVKIAQDFRTYYSLGYSPAHFGDGRYYRIEVKVKGRKGLRIRHREGYRDKTASARAGDSVLSALIHKIDDNPIGIDLGFGPQTAAERGNFMVPMAVSIPLRGIALVPAEGSRVARLQLYVAVQDEQGDTSEIQNVDLPITIPEADFETAQGQSYLYKLDLLMRRGLQRVAIGVRDEFGAEFSLITRTVDVGGS